MTQRSSEKPAATWPFDRDLKCPFDPPPALAGLRESAPVTQVRLYDGRPGSSSPGSTSSSTSATVIRPDIAASGLKLRALSR